MRGRGDSLEGGRKDGRKERGRKGEREKGREGRKGKLPSLLPSLSPFRSFPLILPPSLLPPFRLSPVPLCFARAVSSSRNRAGVRAQRGDEQGERRRRRGDAWRTRRRGGAPRAEQQRRLGGSPQAFLAVAAVATSFQIWFQGLILIATGRGLSEADIPVNPQRHCSRKQRSGGACISVQRRSNTSGSRVPHPNSQEAEELA